jgi:HEPN domain-containing protein
MKPLSREWVSKAEGDFATASRESRARKSPNFDAVCFHAQQCAEKYLKAILQEAGVQFGRTHHLIALLDLLLTDFPSWELLRPQLQNLNIYSVSIRYPGESADKVIACEALKLAASIRKEARKALGLKNDRKLFSSHSKVKSSKRTPASHPGR